MSLKAVFFDMGGVILRTEHQAPREQLAASFGLSYDDLSSMVFESESSKRASLGKISVEQHWASVSARLSRPADQWTLLRDAFFAGDVVDHDLMQFIRSLRPAHRTGIISNAWPDLHDYFRIHGLTDAFDVIIGSADAGMVKPDPRIYELALQRVGAQAAEAAFVDDMGINVEAASKLGMHGIQFRDRAQTIRDIRALIS